MNGLNQVSSITRVLDATIFVSLFLFAAFAPHSIAVTQCAWFIGMLCWVVKSATVRGVQLWKTPLDYLLLGFFILSGLTACLSYEPVVSIGKMRAASLFTIVYLFAENVVSRKIARALALTLVGSCMVNVAFTAVTRVVGKGVKVQGVKAESPLSAATITNANRQVRLPIVSGDTILSVDGHRVRTADEIADLLVSTNNHPDATVMIYRSDEYPPLRVSRGHLLPGTTAEQQLGITGWAIGRDWRAKGFFGHYVTYAEALQLIASLALGLFICQPVKKSRIGLLLFCAVAGLLGALMLTVTRASWLAFLVSAAVMLILGTSRRIILIAFACAIPIVIAGAIILQQKRHVGLIDQRDGSVTWRETVWREGFDLLKSKPRHLLVGVGMDSIKSHWRQWGLFDQGRLPIGHMHSDFLEIALERGVPALLLWMLLMGVYGWTMLKTFRRLKRIRAEQGDASDWFGGWVDPGIVLGGLGGLSGFLVSGLVHYNWGDSEVVMIFYFLMGLTLIIVRKTDSQSV